MTISREQQAAELVNQLTANGSFDPFAMVDACQSAVRKSCPEAEFFRRVQQAEWELLFDYSYQHAVGA